jgi:hypothetical protein
VFLEFERDRPEFSGVSLSKFTCLKKNFLYVADFELCV